MPYVGELIIDSVSAKIDHQCIQNQPSYATIDQMVSFQKPKSAPLDSVQGNLSSKTESIELLKEVSKVLDDLKIPTDRIMHSKSAGFTGQIKHDSNFVYVCIGTNNWKRIPLDSF